jgi:hypothetical protein
MPPPYPTSFSCLLTKSISCEHSAICLDMLIIKIQIACRIFTTDLHSNWRDFVSHKRATPTELLELKPCFEIWRTNRKYVREPIPDEL